MGIVFGKTGVAEPAYKVTQSRGDYEIRAYPPYVVAEVRLGEGPGDTAMKDGFRTLAKYIGVFGDPQNTKKTAVG